MSRADIVYIVSRFPLTTETFIVRELDGLDGSGRFDLELRSLFPSPDTVVHDIARRWDERLIRPSAGQAVAGGKQHRPLAVHQAPYVLRFRAVTAQEPMVAEQPQVART